jgi:hypothetical protein
VKNGLIPLLIILSSASVSARIAGLRPFYAPDPLGTGPWGQGFGWSVSISGDVCVVGTSPWSDSPGAFIYRHSDSNWVCEADISSSGMVGESVSIEGDVCIVGDPYDDDNGPYSGSAYVFRYNGYHTDPNWILEAKLLPSDGSDGDQFGSAVFLKDELCIVGAPQNLNNDLGGAAYIYRYNDPNWVEEAKLTASDSIEYDGFGYTVAIDGNRCVISTGWGGEDAAYAFRYDEPNWVQEVKFIGPENSSFGASVALGGNVCIVGAPNARSSFGEVVGAAYVFRYEDFNWVYETELLGLGENVGSAFGASVSISGDLCLIGAPWEFLSEQQSGAAYLFEFNGNTWILKEWLVASDTSGSSELGMSVSIDSGGLIAAGAPSKGEPVGGAVYTFGICPSADVNGDCFIDLGDLAEIASQWLTDWTL